MSELLIAKTGNCMYCGESRIVQVSEYASEEEICQEATYQCDCMAAEMMRAKERQRVDCINKITDMLQEEYPDIAKLMVEAVGIVQAAEVRRISISTDDNAVAKLTRTSNGIKIELEKKKKKEDLA